MTADRSGSSRRAFSVLPFTRVHVPAAIDRALAGK